MCPARCSPTTPAEEHPTVVHEYTADRLSGWVSDFCQGDGFGSYPSTLTSVAEGLLLGWMTAACDRRDVEPEDLIVDDLRKTLLSHCALLDLPAAAHASVPGLCRDFLADLEPAGRLADGRALGQYMMASEAAYQRALKGEVEQIRRPGAKLGRNDPCPCGSGKKYKRCCMGS
ncbi:MAG: hypothetical protein ACI9EF_000976 [Pseudohongiellaceae bacterium]|jgi:hypothetical protein